MTDYYELTAEHVARRYGNSLITNGNANLIRALVGGIPDDTLCEIESDIPAWERRVAEYCYGIAMNKVASTEY
jgi:hypothetical protein